jgi:hypothetical protein
MEKMYINPCKPINTSLNFVRIVYMTHASYLRLTHKAVHGVHNTAQQLLSQSSSVSDDCEHRMCSDK